MLFDFLLFEKMDQRNCIKFCVKNEIKYARTFEMLTVAFCESTINRTQVLRKSKKMSMTMLVLVGENIEAVKKMILDYRRTTITAVAYDVVISFSSC